MKHKYTAILMVVAFVATTCSRVPLTGRRQFRLLPESEVQALARDEYRSFINQSQVVTGTNEAQLVQDVGQKLSAAVHSVLSEMGRQDLVEGYNWEFNLVQNNQVNAWVMPGGKVVFYTGIMPITQDERGVAVVMGHEVAHAVARHGNERMSQMLAQQLGGLALSVALANRRQETQQLFMAAYGIGTQVGVILPYSRAHELEADKLGLIFMARAGYDPNEAVKFWERMSAQGGGGGPEFLSTHPSDQRRIKAIRDYIPTAMKYAPQQ